jgi:hypothetical protein
MRFSKLLIIPFFAFLTTSCQADFFDQTATTDEVSVNESTSLYPSDLSLTDMTINHSELSLYPGQDVYMSSTIKFSNGATFHKVKDHLTYAQFDADLVWFSEDESIATVSNDGIITTHAIGETKVRVSYYNYTLIVDISVTERPLLLPDLTGIRFSEEITELSDISEPLLLTAEYDGGQIYLLSPDEMLEYFGCQPFFTSSDTNVAFIGPNHRIFPRQLGQTTINATCGEFTDSMNIDVTGVPTSYPPFSDNVLSLNIQNLPEEVSINTSGVILTDITFDSGEITDIYDTFISPNGGVGRLTWQSTDTNIIQINNGIAEFVGLGQASIRAELNGVTDRFDFTVKMHRDEPISLIDAFLNDQMTYTEQFGTDADFGHADFPEILWGVPDSSRLDVVSFGTNGSVTIELADYIIVDGAGTDFTVFENPILGTSFRERARVSVSEDGNQYYDFPCQVNNAPYLGCAGANLVDYTSVAVNYLDASISGGDQFDLSDLGLSEVRFIKITDLGTCTSPVFCTDGKTGFDMDALVITNGQYE